MAENQPVKKLRAGAISVSVFKNNGKGRNGEATTFNSVVLQKRYKDKNGDWQTSNSFNVNDLPKAAMLMTKVYELIVMKQAGASADSEEQSEQDIEDPI